MPSFFQFGKQIFETVEPAGIDHAVLFRFARQIILKSVDAEEVVSLPPRRLREFAHGLAERRIVFDFINIRRDGVEAEKTDRLFRLFFKNGNSVGVDDESAEASGGEGDAAGEIQSGTGFHIEIVHCNRFPFASFAEFLFLFCVLLFAECNFTDFEMSGKPADLQQNLCIRSAVRRSQERNRMFFPSFRNVPRGVKKHGSVLCLNREIDASGSVGFRCKIHPEPLVGLQVKSAEKTDSSGRVPLPDEGGKILPVGFS